jgi:hypothetical protein
VSNGSVNITGIVGGVVGAAGALVLVALIALFIHKRNKRNLQQSAAAISSFQQAPPPGTSSGPQMSGKPELMGTALLHPPPSTSPHPSAREDGTPRTHTVSPVSAGTNAFTPPPPNGEMYKPTTPNMAELHAQQGHVPQNLPPELQGGQPGYGAQQQENMPSEMPAQYGRPQGIPLPPELQGGQYTPQNQPMPPELHGGQHRPPGQPLPSEAYGQQIHEFPSQNQQYEAQGQNIGPPRAELQGQQGMSWQSGPVNYHEMDGNYNRGGPGGQDGPSGRGGWGVPHAR